MQVRSGAGNLSGQAAGGSRFFWQARVCMKSTTPWLRLLSALKPSIHRLEQLLSLPPIPIIASSQITFKILIQEESFLLLERAKAAGAPRDATTSSASRI